MQRKSTFKLTGLLKTPTLQKNRATALQHHGHHASGEHYRSVQSTPSFRIYFFFRPVDSSSGPPPVDSPSVQRRIDIGPRQPPDDDFS